MPVCSVSNNLLKDDGLEKLLDGLTNNTTITHLWSVSLIG